MALAPGRSSYGHALGPWLVAVALALPCVYHGLWNLSSTGAEWWQTTSNLPPSLRYLIGGAELAAALGLVTGVLRRWAALGLVPLFLGAIPHHLAAGFSFKHGGYEPPLVYALVALGLALSSPSPKGAPHANRST